MYNKIIYILALIEAVLITFIGIKFIEKTNPQENYWETANIEIAEDYQVDSLEEELAYIPQQIVQRFNDRHWKITLDESQIDQYNAENNKTAVGVTFLSGRKIVVSRNSEIAHEMGHFYHFEMAEDYDSRIRDCYEKEGKTVICEGMTGYSAMNHIEYFASFFDYYIKNLDNKEAMDLLKERKPDTFELFEELRANNWNIKENRIERFIVQITPFSSYIQSREQYFDYNEYIKSMEEFINN